MRLIELKLLCWFGGLRLKKTDFPWFAFSGRFFSGKFFFFLLASSGLGLGGVWLLLRDAMYFSVLQVLSVVTFARCSKNIFSYVAMNSSFSLLLSPTSFGSLGMGRVLYILFFAVLYVFAFW